jgi:hypothetical protein
MKKTIVTLLILFGSIHAKSQDGDTKQLVDSINLINADSIDCNTAIYWRIVAKGKEAIPFLFDKLMDSAITNVQHPCKMKTLTAGDIAFLALNQIADFPAFVVLKIQFDVFSHNEKGKLCWSLYDFVFTNASKKYIQQHYKDWWEKEQKSYKEVKLKSDELQDCLKKTYGITKHYRWKD